MEPNDDSDDYRSKLDEGTYTVWKEENLKQKLLFPRFHFGRTKILGPIWQIEHVVFRWPAQPIPHAIHQIFLFSFFLYFFSPWQKEFSFTKSIESILMTTKDKKVKEKRALALGETILPNILGVLVSCYYKGMSKYMQSKLYDPTILEVLVSC